MKTTSNIITEITDVLEPLFNARGFELKRKKYFEYDDSKGNIFQYDVDVKKNKGYFSLHLILNVSNAKLMRQVNRILELALRDNEYEYPSNWNAKIIESTIKGRINNKYVYSLTDWRDLKQENETLEEFNTRFSIWFCVFDDLNEKAGWINQLTDSVNMSVDWFFRTCNDEWIISNTDYPALYLLKERNRLDELEARYLSILSKANLKKEVELFMKHLIKYSCY